MEQTTGSSCMAPAARGISSAHHPPRRCHLPSLTPASPAHPAQPGGAPSKPVKPPSAPVAAGSCHPWAGGCWLCSPRGGRDAEGSGDAERVQNPACLGARPLLSCPESPELQARCPPCLFLPRSVRSIRPSVLPPAPPLLSLCVFVSLPE